MFSLQLVTGLEDDLAREAVSREFGDSLGLLEQDLENVLEYQWPARNQAWRPVFLPLGGGEEEPDSMDLMEEFLARPEEGQGRVAGKTHSEREAPMVKANGTPNPEALARKAEPVNGTAGEHGEDPGWIYLAAESLANFEAVKGWGAELPVRVEDWVD